MMHKKYLTLALCSLTLALMSGCSSPGVGGSDYTTTEVRGEQSVRLGTVESVRKVRIQSNEPGILGALGGGVAGAALGSTIGGGNGNAAATVLGALAAGAAGDAAQNALSTQNGVEITIRLDSGYVIAVTQGADEVFHVGDRVQVLGGGGATRVTKLDPNSSLGPTGRNSSAPGGTAPSNANGQQIHYYCPDSNAYYPAVPNCKSPWMKVVR
jgi:outer membrane lipoprotein SlyB